ncbi:MAG TPA: FAD-binding protein [Thermoleophilaceae bacterium]
MSDLVVAGAGMAGLVAAAEARRLGADPLVLEKLERPGGSMRLSSGVIWRHREFERFRADCPAGSEPLQRALFERLDDDMRWLESLGAPVVDRATGNPLTTGTRFDPEGLTLALERAAGEVRLGQALEALPDGRPVVLATGGFPASEELLRRHVTPEAPELLLRAAPGGTGDGLRLGLDAGGEPSAGMAEVYGRNMPAPPARVEPGGFVPLAQLYARHAEVTNGSGDRYECRTWSEIDVLQWTARQPRARAWFTVPEAAFGERVGARTVGEMVEGAVAAGADVRRDAGAVTVETVAGVTTTLGGLAVDAHARVAPGVFACGTDAGGIATGGYASGLAAALVLGRIAARAALGAHPEGD